MLVDTAPAPRVSWVYSDKDDERDLRIDFIRGLVMFVLVIIHVELLSLYNFVVWERIGVVSGGEGFVILSGYVTGFVSRKRLERSGWETAARKLVSRAAQLWRVNVAAIGLIAALALIPGLDTSALTTFTDRGSNQTYSLFPPQGTSAGTWLWDIALLKIGPHQLQILGLYVCLLLAAPLVLKAMARGWTIGVLGLSWAVYAWNAFYPSMPTGAQFEYGFPLLTWQVLFVHGMAIGYHRARVWRFLAGKHGKYVLGAATCVFAVFLFWAQNTPNPMIPAYARISLIRADVYRAVYDRFMQKNTLGILRLVDYAAVLIVGYAVLTRFWTPIRRALGWFFIPLGQASLYVFVMHLPVVAIVNRLLPFGFPPDHHDLWINTIAHTGALLSLWLLVRYKVLFRWIPR